MDFVDKVLASYADGYTCLYRIARGRSAKIVYTQVDHVDLIPEYERTYGPGVIQCLSKLREWGNDWDTLTVSKVGDQIVESCDAFKPHALSKTSLIGQPKTFPRLELRVQQQLKSRTSIVCYQDNEYILKEARFDFEAEAIGRENEAYKHLFASHAMIAPELVGYACEGPDDRVTGLVLQLLHGRRPELADIDACQMALRQLHQAGIVHGDLNPHNILVTEDGIKFLDFEASSVDSSQEKTRDMTNEMDTLREKVGSQSTAGRPW